MPKSPEKADADNPVAAFESSMEALESLVEQLESGDLDLEQTLNLYERGVALGASCRKALDAAEARLEELGGDPDDAPAGGD